MRCAPLLVLFGTAGCAMPAPASPHGAPVVTETVTRGDDWFAVVNETEADLALDDFVFVDHEGDLDRAAAFPAIVLGPGERYVQHVSRATQGFQLGRRERVWIYAY